MRVGIIDYGVGNLASIQSALKRLRVESVISSNPAELQFTNALILPGDGAAGKGMENLRKLNLDSFLQYQLDKKIPFLGICLGMQLLMDFSEEGNSLCLGIIKGRVTKIQTTLKIPQIGWNTVVVNNSNSRIMQNVKNNSYFYFINSFICKPKESAIISGITNYGETFCSVFERRNIYGVQFHPEKSGENGMQLLKNFLEGAK